MEEGTEVRVVRSGNPACSGDDCWFGRWNCDAQAAVFTCGDVGVRAVTADSSDGRRLSGGAGR